MGAKPYMTSDDLIEAVKRKIAVPLNQRTFSEDDILKFANEEMMISQVPDILQYHSEYFVYSEDVELLANQQRYPIPERAMGGKLRDIFYVDSNGNLSEMVKIEPDDKSYWQRESGNTSITLKYYIEGNDIVLAPHNVSSPTGTLRFSYFLRPNQLVATTRAATIQSFYRNLIINLTDIVAGDTVTVGEYTLTAVTGSPNSLEFQITGSSSLTATNLTNAINSDTTYTASSSSAVVSIFFTNLSSLGIISQDNAVVFPYLTGIRISSNSAGISVASVLGIKFNAVPTNITNSTYIDFLQTKPGHKLYSKDILPVFVSTDSITFALVDVPYNLVVGDYICEQYECIIPQIPPDLHNGLAERVGARMLAAQGDLAGFQVSESKIAEIKRSEGILTENRVDGSTSKVNQRKSLLSYQRMGIRRRI